MSYFDNANTNVTRKSFGSKVDKTFQREGVIPVKNRKKEEIDYVAESARFNELNKRVESRRLNELKESRAYNIALNEGYDKLKDSLIKDFMSQICVESLLIDEDVVNNTLKKMLPQDLFDKLAEFFKIIGDTTRTKILFALDQNEMCVCDIANVVGMSKSSVSHQLAILRNSGIVKYRREGKEVYYTLDDEHVKQVFEVGIEHIEHKNNN